MGPMIKNMINNKEFRVPACTVKAFPCYNLMVHKALGIAKRGDIVVVDEGASSMNSIIRDLVFTKAYHRGIAALVIDELIRDVSGIKEVDLPVYK